MKKLNFKNVIMCFVSILLFVSCLGKGPNIISGQAFGIVRYDYISGLMLLDINEYESLNNIRFQEATDGACYWVYFEVDYDLPENNPEYVASVGYYTVNIIERVQVNDWDMYDLSGTDTSTVLTNEIPISDPFMEDQSSSYIKGMFFLSSLLTKYSDQEMLWFLYCDFQNLDAEENHQEYYDLFMRTRVNSNSAKSTEKNAFTNAFNMGSFLEHVAHKERSLGNNAIKIRFNYVSAIDDDKITWSHKDIEIEIDLIFPTELNK